MTETVRRRSAVPTVAWVPWALRAAWITVGVAGASAIDSATADRSAAVGDVATIGGAVLWLIGVAAMALPATWALTMTRVVVPIALVASIAATVGGAETMAALAFVVTSVLATALAASSELGHVFVGASAYGDELRFPLRSPLGYGVVAATAWLVWAVALVTGPLLLAARPSTIGTVAGGVLTALALAGTVVLTPRWHRLSRRWMVLVPAGLVLHDPLVLGETVMLKRSQVAGLSLARADTEAFDLTGPASGHAVEVRTTEAVTALVNPGPSDREARVIHLTAYLAAPSRPGRLLSAAQDRGLRVG